MRHLYGPILALAVLMGNGQVLAGETAAGTRDSRSHTEGLPEGVSPWWPSRYGADDQLGSLNELSPEVLLAALSLVNKGEVIDLGRVLDQNTPKFPGRYWHQTIDLSAHETNQRRPDATAYGWGKRAINWIGEIQVGTFQVGTQLDSIGHIQTGDRFYNGWRTTDVVESWGLNRFGVETIPPVITRGIVVDMPGLTGVERLEAGEVITVQAFEAALARQDLEVRAGDVVLFHTGWGGLWGTDNAQFLAGEPGPGLALINHLYERRVAMVGTDTWSIGPVPGEDPTRPFIVPQTMYVELGLFGMENLATERLIDHGVGEFLFLLTHAKTRGSTAAIISPAAVY